MADADAPVRAGPPAPMMPMPMPPRLGHPQPHVVEPEPVAEPESANAPMIGSLVCTTAGCSHAGHHIALHADTVQPVHCGGCFAILHCEHADAPTKTTREGTIGAPVQRTVTACRGCGTVLNEHTADLPPIDLASLPVGVLDTPLPS